MSAYDDAIEGGAPSLPILAERQRNLARSVGDLLKWRSGREGMDSWRGVTDERINALADDIKTVKRMLWGLIFTSIVGFGSVAIAVYFGTKGAHTP